MNLEPTVQRHATCPLCHATEVSVSDEALAAGAEWRCATCGQRWDARQLATFAAYAAWALQHDRAAAIGSAEAAAPKRMA